MANLELLNEEQLKPVIHTEGAVMVTAGAGSGKTRVLTSRISYLIEDKKVPAYNILAITFTNKAAGEMRDRLPAVSGAWIMTFHAMCARILRSDIERLGYNSSFSVYAESDKERVIKRLLAEQELENDKYLKPVLNVLSDLKNSDCSVDEYEKTHAYVNNIKKIIEIVLKYEEEMFKCNALDFDDLLLKTYELFKRCPDVLNKYQDKFRYILVDEFQDTNEVQYNIVKLLAGKYGNIFVVGDEDQSIYGWRGANFRNLMKISKDFDCAVYKLEQNYRSSKNILSAANQLIKNNKVRIDKTLWTNGNTGARIEIFAGNDEIAEAEYVASQIYSLRAAYGYHYSDFAVLIRLNALSRPFEERFLSYNIPHTVYGGIKFYERKEIKDIIAYLKIAANPLDKEAILRVINYPKRGIGNAVLGQLNNYCAVTGLGLYEVIAGIEGNTDLTASVVKKLKPFSDIINNFAYLKNTLSLTDFVRKVINDSGIKASLNDDSEENINRRMNVDDFLSSVDDFSRANPEANLEDYLGTVTLYTDIDDMSDFNDACSIATIHSAKGLEFKVVFVAGLDEGITPLIRNYSDDDDIEEERRLMYVGITRARERLFLTRAKSRFLYGERKYTTESRFLNESDKTRREKQAEKLKAKYINEGSPSANISTPVYQRTEIKKLENVDFSKYKVGLTVEHKKFGRGRIINLLGEGNNIFATVEFGGWGNKNIALSIAPLEIINE